MILLLLLACASVQGFPINRDLDEKHPASFFRLLELASQEPAYTERLTEIVPFNTTAVSDPPANIAVLDKTFRKKAWLAYRAKTKSDIQDGPTDSYTSYLSSLIGDTLANLQEKYLSTKTAQDSSGTLFPHSAARVEESSTAQNSSGTLFPHSAARAGHNNAPTNSSGTLLPRSAAGADLDTPDNSSGTLFPYSAARAEQSEDNSSGTLLTRSATRTDSDINSNHTVSSRQKRDENSDKNVESVKGIISTLPVGRAYVAKEYHYFRKEVPFAQMFAELTSLNFNLRSMNPSGVDSSFTEIQGKTGKFLQTKMPRSFAQNSLTCAEIGGSIIGWYDIVTENIPITGKIATADTVRIAKNTLSCEIYGTHKIEMQCLEHIRSIVGQLGWHSRTKRYLIITSLLSVPTRTKHCP